MILESPGDINSGYWLCLLFRDDLDPRRAGGIEHDLIVRKSRKSGPTVREPRFHKFSKHDSGVGASGAEWGRTS